MPVTHDIARRELGRMVDETFSKDIQSCEIHLRRLLNHTGLRTLQWVNLNQYVLTFRSLTRV